MMPHSPIPTFDEETPSSARYGLLVFLRNQISPIGQSRRTATSLLQISDIACQVCMTIGKDFFANNDEAQHLLRVLRESFVSDSVGAVYRDVTKFLNSRRPDQTTDAFLMEFDV